MGPQLRDLAILEHWAGPHRWRSRMSSARLSTVRCGRRLDAAGPLLRSWRWSDREQSRQAVSPVQQECRALTQTFEIGLDSRQVRALHRSPVPPIHGQPQHHVGQGEA